MTPPGRPRRAGARQLVERDPSAQGWDLVLPSLVFGVVGVVLVMLARTPVQGPQTRPGVDPTC